MTSRYSRSHPRIVEPLAGCLDHGDKEVMWALATVGALVARADGRIDAVERDELVNFVDRERLVPTISAHDIATAFDSCVRQLEARDGAHVVTEVLRPLSGLSLASIVVRTAERVAAADSQIHSGELEALKLIRQIMRTGSGRQTAKSSSHSLLAEMIFFIVVMVSASIVIGGAMILAVMSELAQRTVPSKATVVSSSDDDNYLELFASGPGRGWYVLGKARGAPAMPAIGSERVSRPEIGAHDSGPEAAPDIVDRALDSHPTSSEE
jgi:tellurite resistance protein